MQTPNPPKTETPATDSDDEKKRLEAEERRRKFEERLKQEQYQRDDM